MAADRRAMPMSSCMSSRIRSLAARTTIFMSRFRSRSVPQPNDPYPSQPPVGVPPLGPPEVQPSLAYPMQPDQPGELLSNLPVREILEQDFILWEIDEIHDA